MCSISGEMWYFIFHSAIATASSALVLIFPQEVLGQEELMDNFPWLRTSERRGRDASKLST